MTARPCLRVGVGGPVGSGKTALLRHLCLRMRKDYNMAVVTNDIYTREDAEFLLRHNALEADRILGVETGGCPHTAIREDASMNIQAIEALQRRHPGLELVLVESGGDNLSATFSPELADLTLYVIDVSGGDKIPRKGGPGITKSDLLIINKVDLAPMVHASLDVMERDTRRMRGQRPYVLTELLSGAGDEFDLKAVHEGRLSPVFFGSALTNFGVEPFLKKFLQMTPPPTARTADIGVIDPFDPHFSAFVFKIQANMNKAHRDRIAFMRICSGKFVRDHEYLHVQGGKTLKLAQPQQLMAQERAIINEAYAGDIIGVFDPGIFSIGDTICEPKMHVCFEGIPTFAPEHFSIISQVDTMKRKQFVKGVTQIAQEGAIQIFHEPNSGMEEVIVGAVGVLQFEVLEYRLKNEYNIDIRRRDLSYSYIRWITSEGTDPTALNLASDTKWVQDFRGHNLLIFNNEWSIRWAEQKNPDLTLAEFSRNW